jgi:hypothetical protein
MIVSRNKPSGVCLKKMGFVFLALLAVVGGVVLAGNRGSNSSMLQATYGNGAAARLVAFEPFPTENGAMCEVTTASAHSTLAAAMAQREEAKSESGQGANELRPSDAARADGPSDHRCM